MNGCDCGYCTECGPAFDSVDNPRPPAKFPPVRAVRGPVVCSCNQPQCRAVQTKPERTCVHGGLPSFHVTYFHNWSGCLSGTTLSDDPDDLEALHTRALAPPREPSTLSDLGSRVEHRTRHGQISHTDWLVRQQRVDDLLNLQISAASNPTVRIVAQTGAR